MATTRENLMATVNVYWDGGDVWGSLLEQGFAVAECLYAMGEDVPAEMGFVPGLGSGDLDLEDDWFAVELRTGVWAGQWTVEDLQAFAREIAAEMEKVPQDLRY